MSTKTIYKFFNLSLKDKILVIEAFILTGIVRFTILFVPFKKLAQFVGNHKEESDISVEELDTSTIKTIAWVISVVSKRTPWESKCLVKALSAQIMLTKYKISSTLYLGVAKDEEKKLIAHAWLRSGTYIVTGGDERAMFTEVAKFANIPRRNRI
ncbi:MAG: lasso peptide biosynthesis B2 protein [Clostridiaceae bacterium]